MKQITKSNLANTLQVIAILIMFGYPGCSSAKMQKGHAPAGHIPSTGNSQVQLKTSFFLNPGKAGKT